MIPASFDYLRAGSVEEAVTALAGHGEDAKVLAGGHSLLPLMKLRLATPSLLVDVARLHELSYIRTGGGQLAIGALTRHGELQRSGVVRQHAPILSQAASLVGDPQVRHRGTIGGSVSHGDPASDLPAALLALGATFVVQGSAGTREISADDFFLGFLETDLHPDEMLTEIRVPAQGSAGWSFQKFTRRAQDWAIVGCAVVRGDTDRVALVNMGPTVLRARAVEDALAAGASSGDAARLAPEGTSPPSDLGAAADYRAHLARVLVGRALDEASAARSTR
ncbi:MAG TPA: xanthine dehydrogenase family protein subunit M [Acidimicrobiales bacterium]|nr:xanthine dehydrogenase family protein subunit M [Acidimicrobiales bacterium]